MVVKVELPPLSPDTESSAQDDKLEDGKWGKEEKPEDLKPKK
jgi:hypothetical protein